LLIWDNFVTFLGSKYCKLDRTGLDLAYYTVPKQCIVVSSVLINVNITHKSGFVERRGFSVKTRCRGAVVSTEYGSSSCIC